MVDLIRQQILPTTPSGSPEAPRNTVIGPLSINNAGEELAQGFQAASKANLLIERENALAWSASAVSKARADQAGLLSESAQQIKPGQDPGDFTGQFLGQFDDYAEKTLESAPPAAHNYAQQRLQGLRDDLQIKAHEIEANARVSWRGAQTEEAIDYGAKAVRQDPSMLRDTLAELKATIGSYNLGPEMGNRALRKASDTLGEAWARTTIETNPLGWLQLKPTDGNNRFLSADAYDRSVNYAHELIAKRGSAFEKAATDARYSIANGSPVPPDTAQTLATTERAAGGDGSQTDSILRFDNQMQAILGQPIPKQRASLADMEQACATGGCNKEQIENLKTIRTTISQNTELLQNDPQRYAQIRRGLPTQPIDFSLLASPQGAGILQGLIDERRVNIATLRKIDGEQVPNKVFTNDELDVLSSSLKKTPPDQRVDVYAGLWRAFGGDTNAYNDTLKFVKDSEPLAALEGVLVGKDLEFEQKTGGKWYLAGLGGETQKVSGRDVARTIAHGQAALASKSVDVPSDDWFKAVLSTRLGSALSGQPPETFANYLEAVKSYYVGQQVDTGKGFPSVELVSQTQGAKPGDDNMVDEAIARTIGVPVDVHAHGVTTAPLGLDEDQFINQLDNAIPAAVHAAGFDLQSGQSVDNFGAMKVGDGRYAITLGRSTLQNSDGSVVVVDLNKPPEQPLLADNAGQPIPETAGGGAIDRSRQGQIIETPKGGRIDRSKAAKPGEIPETPKGGRINRGEQLSNLQLDQMQEAERTLLSARDPAVLEYVQAAEKRKGLTHGIVSAILFAGEHAKTAKDYNKDSGASGLMQIIPSNFKGLGVNNPFDAKESIDKGAQLVADYEKLYAGNPRKLGAVLAHYNGSRRSGDLVAAGKLPNAAVRGYLHRTLSYLTHVGGGTGREASDVLDWLIGAERAEAKQ